MKALFLCYFDSEYHISIEVDVSSYTIIKVPNRLILDDFIQKNLIVFFSQRMIFTVTYYEINNSKLFTIIKIFEIL